VSSEKLTKVQQPPVKKAVESAEADGEGDIDIDAI
jgi:hypothetical protein